MPIVVACPGCPTKLSAPETAAGKQIRCPKCKAMTTVPAFIPAEEVPVVDAAVASPKPKPKPVPVEDEEDDRPRKKAKARRYEENEDDRPRKKKRRYDEDDEDDHDQPRRKKRKAGGSGGLIAVMVVVGLLLLGGIGFGIYALTGKGSLFTKKKPVPAGWKEFSYPNDGFKAYFPKEPQVIANPGNPMGGMGGIGMGGGVGGFPGAAGAQEMESVSTYTSGGLFGNDGNVSITVMVARFRNGVPRALRDQVGQMTSTKMGNIESRRVRWLGYDAGELIMGNVLMRIVYTDRLMIVVQITGPNGQRAKPEEEEAFFDNFELTK